MKTQRNVRVHVVVGIIALITGAASQLSGLDLALVCILIGLVITAEMLNTAIEAAVDLVSPATHELARVAKDVAAGAVLMASCTAVVAGVLLIGRPIVDRLAIIWSSLGSS